MHHDTSFFPMHIRRHQHKPSHKYQIFFQQFSFSILLGCSSFYRKRMNVMEKNPGGSNKKRNKKNDQTTVDHRDERGKHHRKREEKTTPETHSHTIAYDFTLDWTAENSQIHDNSRTPDRQTHDKREHRREREKKRNGENRGRERIVHLYRW